VKIGADLLWQSGNTKQSAAGRSLSLSTNCDNSSMICNSGIALRGIFMGNLQAELDAPTAGSV